jgi:hypothetical protein
MNMNFDCALLYCSYRISIPRLPRPSSLQLGIEISGKIMGARCLMGVRLTRPRVRITDEGLWKSQGGATSSLGCCPVTGGGLNICRSNFDLKICLDGQTFILCCLQYVMLGRVCCITVKVFRL